MELSTGKRLQPYFDQVDRPLVENWKQVTNFNYGLSDPHSPDKAQAIKTLNSQNLPENVKEIKQQIGTAIAEQISSGNIQNRQDVVNTLENAGFEITRQTERSISIKNPDGKRNIRLEGVIYENRQFDKQFAEEHSRAGQDYQRTSRERYETALGKLQRLTESKQQGNRENFKVKPSNHPRSSAENQKRFAFEYSHGSNSGHVDYSVSSLSWRQLVVSEANPEQAAGISRNQSQSRANTSRKTNLAEGDSTRERRQENPIYHGEEQQKSGRLREYSQSNGTEIGKIESTFKTPFENPFNQSNDGKELLKDSGSLFENLATSKEAKQDVKQSNPNQAEQDNAKRLYESLQRLIELVREAIERAKRYKSKSERADRNLEHSESNIEKSERGISQSKSAIKQSQQQIKRSEQQISQQMKEKQIERSASRGFGR